MRSLRSTTRGWWTFESTVIDQVCPLSYKPCHTHQHVQIQKTCVSQSCLSNKTKILDFSRTSTLSRRSGAVSHRLSFCRDLPTTGTSRDDMFLFDYDRRVKTKLPTTSNDRLAASSTKSSATASTTWCASDTTSTHWRASTFWKVCMLWKVFERLFVCGKSVTYDEGLFVYRTLTHYFNNTSS